MRNGKVLLLTPAALSIALVLSLSSVVTSAQTATPAATPVAPSTTIAGCPVFPTDSTWIQNVSALPLYPDSAAIFALISPVRDTFLHPDFAPTPHYPIPYTTLLITPPK